MSTYNRVEVVTTTIRYEFDAPVDNKTVGSAITLLMRDFKEKNDRGVVYDDDWWLEPTDEGVAFCFRVERRKSSPHTPGGAP